MTEENNSENQKKSVEELIKESYAKTEESRSKAEEAKKLADEALQIVDNVKTRCKQEEEVIDTIVHRVSGHPSAMKKNNIEIKVTKKNQGAGRFKTALKTTAVIAALGALVYFGGSYVKDKLSTAQKSKIATSQAARSEDNVTGRLYEKAEGRLHEDIEGRLYEEEAEGRLHEKKIEGRLYEDAEGRLYKEKSADDKKIIARENLEGRLYNGESRRAKKENLEITLTAAQEKTIKKIRAYNSSEEKGKAISEMIQNYKQGDAPLLEKLYRIFAHKGNGDCKNREALIRKLADVQDPEVIDTLKDALKDEDYIIPVIAAYGLAKQGDDSGREIAEKIVNNPTEYKNHPDMVNSAVNTIRLMEKGRKK
jgi:hypothetical protein